MQGRRTEFWVLSYMMIIRDGYLPLEFEFKSLHFHNIFNIDARAFVVIPEESFLRVEQRQEKESISIFSWSYFLSLLRVRKKMFSLGWKRNRQNSVTEFEKRRI